MPINLDFYGAKIELAFKALTGKTPKLASKKAIADALETVSKLCSDLIPEFDAEEQKRRERMAKSAQEESERKREKSKEYRTRKLRDQAEHERRVQAGEPTDPLDRLGWAFAQFENIIKRKTYIEVFDIITLGGQKAGEVWTSDLEKIRSLGVFESGLCEMLLGYAKHSEVCQVRNLVSAEIFADMVERAKKLVSGERQKPDLKIVA